MRRLIEAPPAGPFLRAAARTSVVAPAHWAPQPRTIRDGSLAAGATAGRKVPLSPHCRGRTGFRFPPRPEARAKTEAAQAQNIPPPHQAGARTTGRRTGTDASGEWHGQDRCAWLTGPGHTADSHANPCQGTICSDALPPRAARVPARERSDALPPSAVAPAVFSRRPGAGVTVLPLSGRSRPHDP